MPHHNKLPIQFKCPSVGLAAIDLNDWGVLIAGKFVTIYVIFDGGFV